MTEAKNTQVKPYNNKMILFEGTSRREANGNLSSSMETCMRRGGDHVVFPMELFLILTLFNVCTIAFVRLCVM